MGISPPPASGGGSGTSPAVSESVGTIALWEASNPPGPLAFDWDTDLVGELPAWIAVDTDADWADPDTGWWGSPSPAIVEAGLYCVHLEVGSNAPITGTLVQECNPKMYGEDGEGGYTDFPGGVALPDAVTAVPPNSIPGNTFPVAVIASVTLWLPVGVHFTPTIITRLYDGSGGGAGFVDHQAADHAKFRVTRSS